MNDFHSILIYHKPGHWPHQWAGLLMSPVALWVLQAQKAVDAKSRAAKINRNIAAIACQQAVRTAVQFTEVTWETTTVMGNTS